MIRNILARNGDRVTVNGLTGTIIAIHFDGSNEEIYTVRLDDSKATPEGLYYARHCELIWL